MSLRFGLDKHPRLARLYGIAVLIALPFVFPFLWVIAYFPDGALLFASDFAFNVRAAWSIVTGRYFRK